MAASALSVRWVACQPELSIAPARQEPPWCILAKNTTEYTYEHGGVDVLARGHMLCHPLHPLVDTPRLYSGNGARNYEGWRERAREKGGAGGSSEQDTQLCSQLAREILRAQNGKKSRTLNFAIMPSYDSLPEGFSRKYENNNCFLQSIDHSKYSCES